MRALIASALLAFASPALAETVTVVTQPAPVGTSGYVETESLVVMDMTLDGGGKRLPVAVETEQIHFWDFAVLEAQPGRVRLRVRYRKAWTQTEAMGQVTRSPLELEGKQYEVEHDGHRIVSVVELRSRQPVSPAIAQQIAADLDWVDELFQGQPEVQQLTSGHPYDSPNLTEFVSALGQGAQGTIQARVRGPSDMAGRDTVRVDWGAQAAWDDGGIHVSVHGDGHLLLSRDLCPVDARPDHRP